MFVSLKPGYRGYHWLEISLAQSWLITSGRILGVLAGLLKFYPPFWKARGMEDSQQKDYSFLGNDTFPSLYDAQVYGRKFKNEYLERQFYERLLESEPSIKKLTENKSDLSKQLTKVIYIEWTFHRKIYRESKRHLSKLTLYHLKKSATRWSRRALEPSRIPLLFLRGQLKKFVEVFKAPSLC